MADFLLAAAGLVLFTVAVGLARVLRGPSNADRIMAIQLFGTAGIAALLLIASATDLSGVGDVALSLAVLSAFAAIAFVVADKAATESREDEG